jgi:hypothetical protein
MHETAHEKRQKAYALYRQSVATPHGKLRVEADTLIAQAEQMEREFPVSDETLRQMNSYVAGELDFEGVRSVVTDVIRAHVVAERESLVNEIAELLRTHADGLKDWHG